MVKKDLRLKPLERDFIRLLTDFGFKRIFGSEEHKGLLIRFLNALFEGEMRITDVEFKNKEILPHHTLVRKYSMTFTAQPPLDIISS